MRAKFIFEEQKEGTLFRSSDQEWLIMLLELEGKPLGPFREEGFISFSYDSESGGMDHFGGKEIVIEFDENMLLQQGAEPIYYGPGFFEEFPEISKYVTGYEGEEDYNDQQGFNDPDEDPEYTMHWEDYIQDYEHEEEVVMKKITYEPGLIEHVDIFTEPKAVLIDMLEEFDIPYQIHK